MATRDVVKAQRAAVFTRAREKGLTSDDLDDTLKGNPRMYTNGMLTLINQAVDTPGRFRLHHEVPPSGAFDGANRTFSLAGVVLGKNVCVDHVVQSTGILTPLTLTDNPNPIAGTFYVDNVANAIIVGQAPQASDQVSVTYLTRR